jgi:phosphoglycerate dehydrogenase-like enzyme
MARTPAVRAGKLRLHLENSRKKPAEKQYTLERYLAVANKHRAAARRLEVSVGHDGDIADSELAKVDFMLGVPPDRARLKAAAPNLRWLHCTMAGIDALLPLDWLPDGTLFTNNVGVHGHKAREYVRMAITLLHTRLPQMLANQRERRWQQIFTPALAGKTALVVGLGDVGGGAARAARDLGLKVIGVRRSGKASPLADRTIKLAQLDRLLPQADFLLLAAPNTAETANLINAARIARLKPGCGIVNIGRATLIDHAAMCDRLRDGSLIGAVLDVMQPEPLPADSPYWDVPNLIVTPHISCDDSDYAALTLERWFLTLERLLAGRPLHNRIDPRRGY